MTSKAAPAVPFAAAARSLAAVARRFYQRGWVMGTSGNFSVVRSRDPLRLVISSSGVAKGRIAASHFLEVDAAGAAVGRRRGTPSAETLLHVTIARRRATGAILHTHSIWSTVLSNRHAAAGGFFIEGWEMLKGLDGVGTHEHREWLPIVGNRQDMARLSIEFEAALDRHPSAHGVLLAGHGLYTWGRTLDDAERHVEILEFLLEVTERSARGDARSEST